MAAEARGGLFNTALASRRVARFERLHDYAQIALEDGSILTILNNFVLTGATPESLQGAVIQEIDATPATFTLRFSGARECVVGLADEDWYGPEAMVLSLPGGEIIVWR